MFRSGIILLFFASFLLSCMAEKGNTTPLVTSFGEGGNATTIREKYYETFRKNTNAAEITNLSSSFPVFGHKSVDKEVDNLKINLNNYIYAIENFNIRGKERSVKAVEESYKKLQHFRKKLTPDQDEVMNRYLVRIKTNMTILESEFAQNGLQ